MEPWQKQEKSHIWWKNELKLFTTWLIKILKYFKLIRKTVGQFFCFFFKLGLTPCEVEQPLEGMELQEKETQKD